MNAQVKTINRELSPNELRDILAGWDKHVDFYRTGVTQTEFIINGVHYSIERFPTKHRNYGTEPVYRAVYRMNGKRVSKNVFYGYVA
jgi:hypothetical protein